MVYVIDVMKGFLLTIDAKTDSNKSYWLKTMKMIEPWKRGNLGIMAHYWNGGYTIGMVTILLKRWLTVGMVAILLEWWLYY